MTRKSRIFDFEGALRELEALIKRMESGELPLEESLMTLGGTERPRRRPVAKLGARRLREERAIISPELVHVPGNLCNRSRPNHNRET